jgi:hypothetical protein
MFALSTAARKASPCLRLLGRPRLRDAIPARWRTAPSPFSSWGDGAGYAARRVRSRPNRQAGAQSTKEEARGFERSPGHYLFRSAVTRNRRNRPQMRLSRGCNKARGRHHSRPWNTFIATRGFRDHLSFGKRGGLWGFIPLASPQGSVWAARPSIPGQYVRPPHLVDRAIRRFALPWVSEP